MFSKRKNSLALIAAGVLIPAVAARAARHLAGLGYQKYTHQPPPKNPADKGVSLSDAIVWSMLAGAVGGLARMGAKRSLSDSPIPIGEHDLDDLRQET